MPKFFSLSLFLLASLALLMFQPQKPHQNSLHSPQSSVDLSGCQANYQCYTSGFTLDLSKIGIKATLAELKKYSVENQTVKTYCHSIAHTLGREAYSLTNGNIGKIFTEGNTTCWSGFYHGALEKAFSGSKNLANTAQNLCTTKNGVEGSFLYYNCLHGLGHGLSARFDNEIYSALTICEKLKDNYEQSSCYGGVFMENYVADGINHQAKYLSNDDPIAPCNQVADKFKYNCYQLVSIQILKLNSYNFGEAFTTCEKSEPDYLKVCYQSVGRDISGYTAENADRALEYCYLGNEAAQEECIRAIASDSVYSKSTADHVVVTCKKAKESLKRACYEAAGSAISVLYDSSDARASACAKMEPGYVEICKKSSGL